MAIEPKALRGFTYPAHASRGRFVRVPTVDDPDPTVIDQPDLSKLGMHEEETFRKAVLLVVEAADGTLEDTVFLVCCTCDLLPSQYNRALHAADSTILWPGRVAVFRAAQGSCSCRLVNMRTDDAELALWAVQVALEEIIDEIGQGYDADDEDDNSSSSE